MSGLITFFSHHTTLVSPIFYRYNSDT